MCLCASVLITQKTQRHIFLPSKILRSLFGIFPLQLQAVSSFSCVHRERTVLVAVLTGKFSQAAIMFVKGLYFFFGPVFQIDKSVAGSFEGRDKFIEFELNRLGLLVLCALNEEDHQEGNDRGARVDDKLPRVGKLENWAGGNP
jgi:hypothetical protein